ncbi:MAG: hypothetical protein J5750_01935 [Clostridiales bacterium]|nr:hypothetical protein [Clostridiales bacterium]
MGNVDSSKNKEEKRKIHIKVSLFVALMLLMVLVPMLMIGARKSKEKIIAGIDEKLNLRKSKIVTYGQWSNAMQTLAQSKKVRGENSEDEEYSDYFFYSDPTTDYYSDGLNAQGEQPRYSLNEYYTEGPNNELLLAGAAIIDPDGDGFFLLGDAPLFIYGGLGYHDDIVASSYSDFDEPSVSLGFVGMNSASMENEDLHEVAKDISNRISEARKSNEIEERATEIGWYGDYRYIDFVHAVYYSDFMGLVAYNVALSDGGSVEVMVEDGEVSSDDTYEKIYMETNAGDGIGNSLVLHSETVLFIDAGPELTAWKKQVRRAAVYLAIAYIVIVAGTVILENWKRSTPKVADDEAPAAPQDQIPAHIARRLLLRINDAEQSMGPNGYLDQLKDEIGRWEAPDTSDQPQNDEE